MVWKQAKLWINDGRNVRKEKISIRLPSKDTA